MDNLKIVHGDLLEATEQCIAHQCNCVTTYAAGTAKAIFDRFPYADVYKTRINNRPTKSGIEKMLGTVQLCGNGVDQRYVINMFAQLYPGKPKFPESQLDGSIVRQWHFSRCLDEIVLDLEGVTSVAFPWKIGCNLAGGDWKVYRKMIKVFAQCNPQIQIAIYKMEKK